MHLIPHSPFFILLTTTTIPQMATDTFSLIILCKYNHVQQMKFLLEIYYDTLLSNPPSNQSELTVPVRYFRISNYSD